MKVWNSNGTLTWGRDNELPTAPRRITRRQIFSICGQLVGHLPVCGQLRVMASYLKRWANDSSEAWDDDIKCPQVEAMLQELLSRVSEADPAKGKWDVQGTVWVDASSLATGIVLEVAGDVVEDASWLRHKSDAGHINLAELDAVLRGVNLAIAWKLTDIEIESDSRTVCHWVSDILTGQ